MSPRPGLRADRTPDRPERKPVSDDLRLDTAVLASGDPSRTPAQKAAAEERERAGLADAARGVARWSMLGAHDCTGAWCRMAAHLGDRAARDELLDELGLGGERERAAVRAAARRGAR